MSFDLAISFTLRPDIEGGECNRDIDPGGHTNYGISQRWFPEEDIANMTPERAAELMRIAFWDKCRCDELPSTVAVLVFDAAVNSGIDDSARFLQRAINKVPFCGIGVDGVIGSRTVRAVNSLCRSSDNTDILLRHMLLIRKQWYMKNDGIKNNPGWLARVDKLAEFLDIDLQEDKQVFATIKG